MSLRVLSIRAFPSGSPHRAPTDRDAPFTERSFTLSVSKSPVNEPHSRFPSEAPMERAASFQSLLLRKTASVVWWLAYWPLEPEFAGSNPAEAVGFFGRPENPQYAFLRRGSKIVCPSFAACKRT